MTISAALNATLAAYRAWPEVRKPVLLLSVGADTDARVWRRVVRSSAVRNLFVQRLALLYAQLDVDGLEIAWIHGAVANKEAFAKMFTELRRAPDFPEFAILAATVTAESTYDGAYDVAVLNATTNFLVVEGSRLLDKEHPLLRKGVRDHLEPKASVVCFGTCWCKQYTRAFATVSYHFILMLLQESLALEWEANGISKDDLVIGYTAATPVKWNESFASFACKSTKITLIESRSSSGLKL